MWGLKSPHYCTKISTKLFGSLKNFTYLCTSAELLESQFFTGKVLDYVD